ncbi:MAG: hypothetical protein O2992_11645 [Gemmatimonadetes bacterium]|nr:hypothetical protein [Gemmatimonadota bacterium]
MVRGTVTYNHVLGRWIMERMIMMRWMGILLLGLAACQEPLDLALPSADEIESYYAYQGRLDAELSGNVATVRVGQDAQQLRRGGSLWAKVGPYIFLFTEETHQLFEDFPGLAGVRIVTTVGDAEVASVLLARDELSEVLWRRGMNIAGQARRDGTKRVTLMSDLVRWGEQHTEFEYNPRYTSQR